MKARSLSVLLTVALGRPLVAQCPDGAPPPCRPGRAASHPVPSNTVAVLYFDNLSRDTADAYLADGLTDEITTRLGQIERLTVTSRTTMRRYRGQTGDPQALARTLRVAHLVNGSVRRGPGRLRVGVELVRARDGVQLWTESYDRIDGDVLAIEADVARAVATAIAGRLLPGERATLAARATRNPAAHDRVLRGNYLMVGRREADALRAVEEYRAAIALDQRYADAYARIGWVYSLFRNWNWHVPGVSRDSVIGLAFAAAQQALRLDSASALAWFADASARAERNDLTFVGVERSLDRALSLDPRLAEAHWLHANVRLRTGDAAGFREAAHRALELEPERPITLAFLGLDMLAERRYAEARRWMDSAVAIAPAFAYGLSLRGGIRALQGDPGALTDVADGLRASGGGDTSLALALVAFANAYVGDSAAARTFGERAYVELLHQQIPLFDEGATWLAGAQLRLGLREEALRTLERANPTTWLRFYLRYPFFDTARADERFQRVVASVTAGDENR